MFRIVLAGIIVIMLVTITRAVFSEQEFLTITTYYPAPYGVYRDFTTYGNTSLSQRNGNVTIGREDTTAGVPLKLDVKGTIRLCQPNTTPEQCGILQVSCNSTTDACYAVYAD